VSELRIVITGPEILRAAPAYEAKLTAWLAHLSVWQVAGFLGLEVAVWLLALGLLVKAVWRGLGAVRGWVRQ
jgi:hypothetical protein